MLYEWRSPIGYFQIAPTATGWFLALDGDAFAGPYPSPPAAIENLLSGQSNWPCSVEPARLEIPDEIRDWQVIELPTVSPP